MKKYFLLTTTLIAGMLAANSALAVVGGSADVPVHLKVVKQATITASAINLGTLSVIRAGYDEAGPASHLVYTLSTDGTGSVAPGATYVTQTSGGDLAAGSVCTDITGASVTLSNGGNINMGTEIDVTLNAGEFAPNGSGLFCAPIGGQVKLSGTYDNLAEIDISDNSKVVTATVSY